MKETTISYGKYTEDFKAEIIKQVTERGYKVGRHMGSLVHLARSTELL